MKKEIQIDLFEETNQKSNRKNYSPSLKKLFPYGFVSFRLSYEGLIFSVIISLLACVVIFSLGVERGKHIATLKKTELSISNNKEPVSPYQKKYTIQVATYRDRKLALALIRELMENKYKPFVIYSRNLYHVCVGKYQNKEYAREELNSLLKKYKNSYIRTLPGGN
ncbi:MAG: SPOR domain-containing protein [Candidatus Omnitrophota bacterium]